MMYRVLAVIAGALALSACASNSSLMDAFKPAPVLDTVRMESQPPGAEAKASSGQTCTTPCALALPTTGPLTVTFSLTGYQPATESLEVVNNTGSAPQLQPNPVTVELTAAPPPPKAKKPRRHPAKKPMAKKPAAPKPAVAAPAPAPAAPPPAAAAPAPAPAPSPEPQQAAPSPWPAAPPPAQH